MPPIPYYFRCCKATSPFIGYTCAAVHTIRFLIGHLAVHVKLFNKIFITFFPEFCYFLLSFVYSDKNRKGQINFKRFFITFSSTKTNFILYYLLWTYINIFRSKHWHNSIAYITSKFYLPAYQLIIIIRKHTFT